MARVGLRLAGILTVVLAGCGSTTVATPSSHPPSGAVVPSASPSTASPAATSSAQTGWRVVSTSSTLGPGHLSDVTTFRGSLVAVGANDAALGRIWSSPDGAAWTSTAGALPLDGMLLSSIAAGDPGLVVVGWSDSDAVALFSADGTSWSRQSLPGSHPGSSAMSVAWHGGRFVAVGGGGEPNAAVSWASADGQSWTRVSIIQEGTKASLSSVAAGPGGFVADGMSRGRVTVWRSTDGVSWTRHELPDASASDPTRLRYTGGRFFLPTAGGDLWTSTDGLAWTRTTLPGFGVGAFDVAAIPGGFVAVGRSSDGSEPGVVATTGEDAAEWTVRPADRALEGALPSTLIVSPDGALLVGVGLTISGDSVFLFGQPATLLDSSTLTLAASGIHVTMAGDGTVQQIRMRVTVASTQDIRIASGGKSTWPRFGVKEVGNHLLLETEPQKLIPGFAAGSSTTFDLTFDAQQGYGGTYLAPTRGNWVLTMQLEDETGQPIETSTPIVIAATP